MKAVRILLLIFFLVTAGVYAGITVKARMEADNVPPVITADAEEITVSVNATEEDLLQGVHAEDDQDGDVTKSLVVVSQMDFITKGIRKVNYAAFDSHNNVATYTRKIVYNDYRSPRFSCDSPFHFVYSTNSASIFSGVTADDVIDGDISPNIRIIYGELDEGGTMYPVVLQVTNSAGDMAAISINAYREDRTSYAVPTPALSDYIVYSKVGEDLDLSQYIIGYYKSGTLYRFEDLEEPEYTMNDITRDASGVDFSSPGEYVVTFELHGKDDVLGHTELYWIVEE